MRDRDVRESVWRWLEVRHKDHTDTLMLNEFGLSNGATRVDIAVINGEIEGFELKSERDTLCLLPKQRDIYNKVFDKVSLVVAENHVHQASAIIPCWWGIAIASYENGTVALSHQRAPLQNNSIDPITLSSLLWREEALSILSSYGADKGVRSKPREALYSRLAEALEINTLKFEVRRSLKERKGWRVDR